MSRLGVPICAIVLLGYDDALAEEPISAAGRSREAYASVAAPYHFGDVLMLRAPDNAFVHSCVYIADDIVFTKNGHGRLSPWFLTRLDDLTRVYSCNEPVTV